ncbi:HAD-IIIA family hydrolase [Heyndrickxia oleronia]|uniref:N-acylneuraminate cytidylyltransferase n=1 Tax=Heyndrickxia oleronia TaxID=38875 RepID=A0A8E2I3B9_9BACI|nr:acylneuraminate cytidylyltransferase [Heyndrickxia oleronia]MEC1377401.1 HAD-IIIA family hydrolase [Heyndrickxia oleronia]OOP65972.1 acylneuraminate cytidylyltransferase [Heyndrickxia oleronia]QQZ06040.1 acylneuraminate cytidylyltransferase [Heyndrickxia oleronia]
MDYKNVALIPARGGSKSIPLKNIMHIAGKPLIEWTLEAASKCKEIDHIFVATDSPEIKDVVEGFNLPNVTVIGRSIESAVDTASSEIVLLEFARKYMFENLVFIQATSPLLKAEDLSQAIQKLEENKLDSLLSVVEQKRFIWKENDAGVFPINYDPINRPRRQEMSGYLVENGAFYITSRNALLKSGCRISGKIGYKIMSEESYFEIDEPSDWTIIEHLLISNKNQNEIKNKISKIKMLITDCDGVLTDGGMYYTENGDEIKKFNTKDGMGISKLKEIGIEIAIITGEDVQIVRNRAKKMGISEVYCGIKDKTKILNQLIEKYNLHYENIAYIGDDINDLDAMKLVGLAFTVNDGMRCVKEISDYVTKKNGGQGAVREICELFLS